MKHTTSVMVILILWLLSATASAETEWQIPPEENQAVYKQSLLQFRTPMRLDFCGEPVPLERRDVWERLDKQFLLALSREAQVILWLKRTTKYFPFIEATLTSRNLPDDLKYLAVAESDLNIYARSPKGATGTWQFMEQTGKRFDLEKQEWVDERYNFEKATVAALDYLSSLHDQFGSWMLAVAAYNCGEARMMKEIEEQNTEEYVDLYLPKETEEYLFRIMAIKIILSNPARYGYILEHDDYYLPVITERVTVSLPGMFHLVIIAEAAQTSFRTIKELNPELRGYYLHPGTHTLLIPGTGADGFDQRLSAGLAQADAGMRLVYIVKKGDSLSAIAAQLGIPVNKLMEWNALTSSNLVYVGQKLVYFRPYRKK